MMIFASIFAIVFMFIGIIIFYSSYEFYKKGKKTIGRVCYIERCISKSSSSDGAHRQSNSSRVNYYPIIEYNYKEKKVMFRSSFGHSQLKYKIGETIALLVLPGDEGYVRIDSKTGIYMGVLFVVIGLLIIGGELFFTSQMSGPTGMILYLKNGPLFIAVGVFFTYCFGKLFLKMIPGLREQLLKGKIETEDSLKGREIFRLQSELDSDLNKWKKIFFMFLSVVWCGVALATYKFYNYFLLTNSKFDRVLESNFLDMNSLKETFIYLKSDINLMGAVGILVFLFLIFLAVTHSLVSTIKKL